jgi:hypothetical protein
MSTITRPNAALLSHFELGGEPLTVPRGRMPEWADAAFHESAFDRDPELYALLALAPGVSQAQRTRALLCLLGRPRAEMSAEVRATLDRTVSVLLVGLAPDRVITALLGLRRGRVNNKHVTRAVVEFVLDHPAADAVIRARRPALVDCLEHAVGKATARGCARRIAEGDTTSAYVRRSLLRFSREPESAARRVLDLFRLGTDGTARATELAAPLETPVSAPLDLDYDDRPTTVTATNRGDIAATLVHRYRGGPSSELDTAVDDYVVAATSGTPVFDGTVALVLDLSQSMRSYGDREWAILSQSVALTKIVQRVCRDVRVVEVGGTGDGPSGATDLASALLDALETGADVVAVISDGYENVYPGDLARVVASLDGAGVKTPVVFCHSTYSHSDDLRFRRPAPALPERVFWHEADLGPLLVWMIAHCDAPGADPWLRATLHLRLDTLAALTGRSLK